MIISGLQKVSLLDYPGNICATVFTKGCNFRCPFCHNASLVLPERNADIIYEDEFFEFLNKRKGLIDGVCVTGGEPLLHEEIVGFLEKIKELGFKVKLDTNGSFPERLKRIVEKGLVDYVAVDIKNSLEKYPQTVGLNNFDVSAIAETVSFLLSGKVEYEFRTTVVKEFHTPDDFVDIGTLISCADRCFLQSFKDSGDLIDESMSGCSKDEMSKMLDAVKPYVKHCEIRGVD